MMSKTNLKYALILSVLCASLVMIQGNILFAADGDIKPLLGFRTNWFNQITSKISASADGRYIAFTSGVHVQNVYVRDQKTGNLVRVSFGKKHSYSPSISADGRYVAFSTLSHNIVEEDFAGTITGYGLKTTQGISHIYVADLRADRGSISKPERIDLIDFSFWDLFYGCANGGRDCRGADGSSFTPSLSADGGVVAFDSDAWDLEFRLFGPSNGFRNVYLRERPTGYLFNITSFADGNSWEASINRTASLVTFTSDAVNLVSGFSDDKNSSPDVFLYNRSSFNYTLVSWTPSLGTEFADGPSWSPVLSADGKWIAYTSGATNLDPNDWNEANDVYVYSVDQNRSFPVSGAPTCRFVVNQLTFVCFTQFSEGGSHDASISADGRFIVFHTETTDFSDYSLTDSNQSTDVILRDMRRDKLYYQSYAKDSFGKWVAPTGLSQYGMITSDGWTTLLESRATHLGSSYPTGAVDASDLPEIYVVDGFGVETRGLGLCSDPPFITGTLGSYSDLVINPGETKTLIPTQPPALSDSGIKIRSIWISPNIPGAEISIDPLTGQIVIDATAHVRPGNYDLNVYLGEVCGSGTLATSDFNVTVNASALAPAAPSNLTVTRTGLQQVRLDWTDNSSNETGFDLEGNAGGSWFPIKTVSANIVTANYSNFLLRVERRIAWKFRIRAFNDSGASPDATATFFDGEAAVAGGDPSTDANGYDPNGEPTDANSLLPPQNPVYPAPQISVWPSYLYFGQVELGSSSTAYLTITNYGQAPLDLNKFSFEPYGDSSFEVRWTEGATTVQPGQSLNILVTFTAEMAGGNYAPLLVGSNDPYNSLLSIPAYAYVQEPCSSSSQLVMNPGIEQGSAYWSATPGVIMTGYGKYPFSGSWYAWLDGYGRTHTDSLAQQIYIPATACSASLSFWISIDTTEAPYYPYDNIRVEILSNEGLSVQSIAAFSNLDATGYYVKKTFDLTQWKGQSITLRFNATEDYSLQTSFVLDDINVNIQQ